MTRDEILDMVEQEDVEFIRLQFTDMFGNLKNVAVTANQLAKVLDKKCAFDGSALFDETRASEEELYLAPDLDTFVVLPWRPQQRRVARLLCDIHDRKGNEYNLSPRYILKEVLNKAREKGYDFYVDPQCEFFLFHLDDNGIPTTLTHEKAGYMDVGPMDLGENARRDMVMALEEMGFEIESSHHQKAPGQHEIDFGEAEALEIADSIITFRSAVKSTARRFGLHASFMPKPKKGVAGSGMHMNFSVYKDGKNIFNSKDDELKDEAKAFIAGIMEHARAMCVVTNPLVNSYKRINSGFEAPKEIRCSRKNDNSLLRVSARYAEDTKLEIRFPDSAANPYLAIALCVMAGLDGIEKGLVLDDSSSKLTEDKKTVEQLPGTLREAISIVANDSFLSDVLGCEFVDIYIKAKLNEWDEYMEEVSDWEVKTYLSKV